MGHLPLVKTLLHRVVEELSRARHEPARLLKLFNGRYLRIFVSSFRGAPSGWHPLEEGALKKRSYKSFDLYLKHQAAKPGSVQYTDHDEHIRAALRSIVMADDILRPGMSVLCLGARFGGEVQAFLDLDCFAVGIDIRTSSHNKYVVYGDFQDVQFPDRCVDAVYSNALDHAFDPEKVVSEMMRIVKPDGYLLLDVPKGEGEGHPPGLYESFYWRTVDDLIAVLTRRGLRVVRRTQCEYPRNFEHLVVVDASKGPADALESP